MASVKIHAFLVHPGKNVTPMPTLSGKSLPSSGKLYDLLADIFHAQPDQRDFEVTFRPAKDGTQQNDCRDVIVAFQASPTLTRAKTIAERLQSVTDNRSGMGLLFLMSGQHGTRFRILISRFPANQAIMADIDSNGLDVKFLEQVFIKRMTAYKALMIEDPSPATTFWIGTATDRQAGGSPENISSYWLDDFLEADFSETPRAGTRRLAEALKKAVRANPVLSVKAEIAAAVSLAPSVFKNKTTSIDQFCNHFALSTDAQDSIKSQLSKPALSAKTFKFDTKEFKKKVPYRTIEMETGAILTAPSDQFDKVFDVTTKANGLVEYTTRGRVADQRMTGR